EAAQAGRPPGLQIPHYPEWSHLRGQSFRGNAVQARATARFSFHCAATATPSHPGRVVWIPNVPVAFMKILEAAIIASALIRTTAFAADMAVRMPVKAPPPPPAPVYSWTGFYVGVNVGYSWGRSNNNWNYFNQIASLGGPICPPLSIPSVIDNAL